MISNSPKKRTSNFQRTVKWIGILFGGLLFLKVFIGEWVYISSDSMLPTLRTGNLVWNSKLTYGAFMPQRMKETPILNLLCLVPTIAQKDKQRNWGNHRMWGYSSPQRMDVIIFKWANDDSGSPIKSCGLLNN